MPKKRARTSTGPTAKPSAPGRTPPPHLHVLLTGGTIDKSYDVVGERFTFDEGSIIRSSLATALIENYTVEQLYLIDSRDMNVDHRVKLVEAIDRSPHSRFIIVHGTSAMQETAHELDNQYSGEKTIVLTGALKPIRYSDTEAMANLATACCAARYFPAGVYIAMHGLVERPGAIAKDASTGQFVRTS